MKYYVYILYSESINKYYIGYSTNVPNRLIFHNSEEYNKIWTKRGIPWELKFQQEFPTKSEALKTERFIKKQKNKKFIERIISEGWNS